MNSTVAPLCAPIAGIPPNQPMKPALKKISEEESWAEQETLFPGWMVSGRHYPLSPKASLR